MGAEGFLVSSGNKAQEEDGTAKMEFRDEALEAPRVFIKLATWFLAAFSQTNNNVHPATHPASLSLPSAVVL